MKNLLFIYGDLVINEIINFIIPFWEEFDALANQDSYNLRMVLYR